MVENHGTVSHLHNRRGRILDIALFLQDLYDTLRGGSGNDDHDKHIGQHHQAHEDLHGIREHTHELTGGHTACHSMAADNETGTDPGD